MEHPNSKHRNLRHISGPQERAAALAAFGVGEGAADAAGLKILELRQRDMQELFGRIFGVETKSSNNEWLRSKLLQAVGLPPRWRPAPPPPPSPPADRRPGEYSRFGRRLRATVQPADSEGEEEEEATPRAKRARPSTSGASGSSGSRGASRSPPADDLKPAAPPSAPSAPSGSATGSDAIFSLQARAAAAYASAPPPLHAAAASHPALFYGAAATAPPSLQSSLAAAAQHPPQLQQLQHAPPPKSVAFSVAVPLAPQCAADRAGDLAALLSQEGSGALIMPPMPLQSGTLQSSLAVPGVVTLSAQLHMLYADWEEGRVSLALNPSEVLL